MERNVYLDLQNPAEARKLWLEKLERECAPLGSEKIALEESAGRVASTSILAERSSPAFHGAAMDGYAIAAEAAFGASPAKPVKLQLDWEAWAVNTGQPLPRETNAVVMVEDVSLDDSGRFLILEKPVFPWQHVRKTGEDIVETEVILSPGTVIGPAEIGALAAGGVLWPEVFRLPKVVIIPSGSDLTSLKEATEEKLRAGAELPEFNSLVFSAMLKACAASPEIMPIVPDDPELLKNALLAAEKNGADLILLNAGTSAGTHDYSREVIGSLGEILTHGVAMMPGKPVLLGIAILNGRKVPVAAIPGYPVSAFMAMEEFVIPLICRWQKREPPARETMSTQPLNALPSKPGMEEHLRVKLGVVGDTAWAVPLPRGAGTVTSLSRADAIISIPPESEGINAGQRVEARLLRSKSQIEGALLAIGSHDASLDLIDGLLRARHPRFRLTSAHVGSLGGLLALSRGQAHLAGTHLLDPETGIYNRKALKEYLKDLPVALVRLAGREQGLMVARGNPLNISSLGDIAAGKFRFVNRQKGSGTRVLLDYQLKCLGISPAEITGYADEEYTHMNVAQAVLSGRADAGLGVAAAARALDLDFLPVGNEEYELAIPLAYMEDERILALLELIRSEEFRETLDRLGGYNTSMTGEIVWRNDR